MAIKNPIIPLPVDDPKSFWRRTDMGWTHKNTPKELQEK